MPDQLLYFTHGYGIRGAQLSNVGDIQHNIDKLREVSHSPAAVGFGVATPDDAARVSKMADGVIVGSAIVKRIASRNGWRVAEFVGFLKSVAAPA